MRNEKVKIKRPYQCGIAVYQLAKVGILEFCNDFVDKYLDRRDYELIQIDTKAELLATTKYSERKTVFFKTEFVA